MRCERCEGFMVHHQVFDPEEPMRGPSVWSWRCVACGNLVDPVIRANQRRKTGESVGVTEKSRATANVHRPAKVLSRVA
ncbi:MAG: hypothetical protein ACREI3_11815 [Nitrospirales bacterium]